MDKKVIPWVNWLNSYPGVETVGSCGGHKNPKDCSQAPQNEFYVQFRFDTPDSAPTKDGWDSICNIVQYITECEFSGDAYLRLEFSKTALSDLFFTLHGRNVDADIVPHDE